MRLSEQDVSIVKALQNCGYTKTECHTIIERDVYRLGKIERQTLALIPTTDRRSSDEALARLRNKKREQLLRSIETVLAIKHYTGCLSSSSFKS